MTFSNVTPRWEDITTPSGLTIPGGRTGIRGVYLRPTLQPGERPDGGPNGVFLILTFTGNALFPATFTVQASPQEAPNLSGLAVGSVAVRAEFVQVAVVTPTPAFTNPGGSVAVAARILNAGNREQSVLVHYVVRDAGGAVVFTSASVPATLGLLTSLLTVNLPALDTTGLALGDYTITVTVTDSTGTPIPGGTGLASLLVGFGITNLTYTWRTEITGPTGLPVGESIDVTFGTTVEFVRQGTPGSFALPSTSVSAPNVVAFSPPTQTVLAGNEATYTITLTNPSRNFLTYTLSLQGVPTSWATIDRFVFVGPHDTVQVTLRLRPDLFAKGDFGFVVFAAGGGRACRESSTCPASRFRRAPSLTFT